MKSTQISCCSTGTRAIGWAMLMAAALASGSIYAEGRGMLSPIEGPAVDEMAREPAPVFNMNFGSVLVGSTGVSGVQYTNIGDGPITDIVMQEIVGDAPDVFSTLEDNCTGMTLDPDESCVIWMQFDPPDMANFSAEFSITSTASNSPQLVRMLGRGVFDDLFSDRFE